LTVGDTTQISARVITTFDLVYALYQSTCTDFIVRRLKPEQASKVEMRMPTRLQNGEGRANGEVIDKRTRLDPPG
jgi:hypothetical protein